VTDEIIAKFKELTAGGASVTEAAKAVGISTSSAYKLDKTLKTKG